MTNYDHLTTEDIIRLLIAEAEKECRRADDANEPPGFIVLSVPVPAQVPVMHPEVFAAFVDHIRNIIIDTARTVAVLDAMENGEDLDDLMADMAADDSLLH